MMGYYLYDLKIASMNKCAGIDYFNNIVLCFPNIPIDCDIVDVRRKGGKFRQVGLFEVTLSLIEHEVTHIVIESICDTNTSNKLDCTNLEMERMNEYVEDNI